MSIVKLTVKLVKSLLTSRLAITLLSTFKLDLNLNFKLDISHTIDFRTPEILATEHNAKDLLIKETLLIQENSSSINVDKSSIACR